jgi:hypothetical protein
MAIRNIERDYMLEDLGGGLGVIDPGGSPADFHAAIRTLLLSDANMFHHAQRASALGRPPECFRDQ